MKKKKIYIVLLCLILAAGILGWNWLGNYSRVLDANWGFSLPWKALYREIYQQDSGPSFHGDGIRYHVYSYQYEDYIDLMFAWMGQDGDALYGKSYSQSIAQWLTELNVPQQWQPDYDNGNAGFWYKSQHDNSQIIVVWNQTLNRLYIAEHFL